MLIFPLVILAFTAISVASRRTLGRRACAIRTARPSEILYAFSSGAGNNGSAFGGLGGEHHWYNTTIGITMLLGPVLHDHSAVGDRRQSRPEETCAAVAWDFPGTTPLFTCLLVSVIVIVGALTFFPVLSLGPIVEHLLMAQAQVF